MLESEDGALPLSRGQLDIWLSQESGLVGAEWQLGLLVRIEGKVERVLLEQAVRQAINEAEPARAAFLEVNGQIVQRAIDHSELVLDFHDVRDSEDPVEHARQIASSIQRTLMPLTDQLLKFALIRTADDQYYMFGLVPSHQLGRLGHGDREPPNRIDLLRAGRGGSDARRLLRHPAGAGRAGGGV
ncbi:condensation domain-containing protein [Mycobacteroides chelonae]|nr:condensation domain-containing protein [Mycobacteroides chelonae]